MGQLLKQGLVRCSTPHLLQEQPLRPLTVPQRFPHAWPQSSIMGTGVASPPLHPGTSNLRPGLFLVRVVLLHFPCYVVPMSGNLFLASISCTARADLPLGKRPLSAVGLNQVVVLSRRRLRQLLFPFSFAPLTRSFAPQRAVQSLTSDLSSFLVTPSLVPFYLDTH